MRTASQLTLTMANTGRILIVEDQYLVANDCEFHLKSAGFDCVGLASTADEAVALADRTRPDLIVMDIRLANNSDGVRAAIEIFQRFRIRCIFTSGHADAATRTRAIPAHPYGWLNKPYMPDDLIAAVRTACEATARSSA